MAPPYLGTALAMLPVLLPTCMLLGTYGATECCMPGLMVSLPMVSLGCVGADAARRGAPPCAVLRHEGSRAVCSCLDTVLQPLGASFSCWQEAWGWLQGAGSTHYRGVRLAPPVTPLPLVPWPGEGGGRRLNKRLYARWRHLYGLPHTPRQPCVLAAAVCGCAAATCTCKLGAVPVDHGGWSAAGLQGVQGGQCGVDIQHIDAQQQAAAAAAADVAVVNMPPGIAAATAAG